MTSHEVKPGKNTRRDSFYKNADGSVVIEYDENGNISSIHDENKKRYIAYTPSGEVKFEFSPHKTYINGKCCAPYKLGIKNRNHENHWQENTTLNPHRKTVIMLGGKATYNAREANGYLNSIIETFGISAEQVSEVQLVSCYRLRWNSVFNIYLQKTKADFDLNLWEENFRKKEILQKLMPFMANKFDSMWERLPPQELYKNFRNIMLVSHCCGADDLVKMSSILRQTMTELGYSADIQKRALKQIICITNNNWREFKDDNGFTSFHRYSVYDGQGYKAYKEQYSSDYPVFLEKYLPFRKFDGKSAAFVNTKKNEMLMVFDKILKYGGGEKEHNSAFFITNNKFLTHVGRLQAQIFKRMWQYWQQDNQSIKSAADFLRRSMEGTLLAKHVEIFTQNGKKLQKAKMNPIHNPSIIETEYTKYKQNMMLNDEHGAYKLLSDTAKKACPQANPYGCYYEKLEECIYGQSIASKQGRD